MSIESSRFSGGRLYNTLIDQAYKLITRMTSKWGVNCEVYYCQNDLATLTMYSINTDELTYSDVPDLQINLVLPEFWENYGMGNHNVDSHSGEELDSKIFTLPSVKIPLLAKVVVREAKTNRTYIIRKIILEHFNLAELFLEYTLDIMPTKAELPQMRVEHRGLSIFNEVHGADEDNALPVNHSVRKL